jgi:hypothetical protein
MQMGSRGWVGPNHELDRAAMSKRGAVQWLFIKGFGHFFIGKKVARGACGSQGNSREAGLKSGSHVAACVEKREACEFWLADGACCPNAPPGLAARAVMVPPARHQKKLMSRITGQSRTTRAQPGWGCQARTDGGKLSGICNETSGKTKQKGSRGA